MPHATRRSTGYRSFALCSDPGRVLESRTVKKTKTISTQKRDQKVEQPPGNKDETVDISGASFLSKETATGDGGSGRSSGSTFTLGEEEAHEGPTSSHLVEDSRGAQNLNLLVSSCSNGHRQSDNHMDVAEDLLKGTLTLGESLAVLRKLQQDSNYSTKTKKQEKKGNKKNTGKDGGGRFADLESGKMNLSDPRDGTGFHQVGSQGPCSSSDGSGKKDRFEELKRPIFRYGVAAQNLFDGDTIRGLDSSDQPSTSSSLTTSLVHSSDFVSPESSLSSTASDKKKRKRERRLNLIAKLVGLENAFSSPSSPRRPNQGNNKSIVNQRKPMFDLDSPKATRRPELNDSSQELDGRRKTLDEMIEAVKLKRLLKRNNVESPNHLHDTDICYAKQRQHGDDDINPIVVMKPTRYSCLDLELPSIPLRWARADLYPFLKLTRGNQGKSALCGNMNSDDEMLKEINTAEGGVTENPVDKGVAYHVPGLEVKAKRLASPAIAKLQKKQIEDKSNKVRVAKTKERKGKNLNSNRDPQGDKGSFGLKHVNLANADDFRNRRDNMLNNVHEIQDGEDVTQELSSVGDNEPILLLADQLDKEENTFNDCFGEEYDFPCNIASQPSQGLKYNNDRDPEGIKDYLEDRSGCFEDFDCSLSESSYLTSLEEEEILDQEVHKQIYSYNDTIWMDSHVEGGTAEHHHPENIESSLHCGTVWLDKIKNEDANQNAGENKESDGEATREFVEITRWKSLFLSSSSFVIRVMELLDLQVGSNEIPIYGLYETRERDPEELITSKLLLDSANELIEIYGSMYSRSRLHFPKVLHRDRKCTRFTSLAQVVDQVCDGILGLRCPIKDAGSDCHSSDNLMLMIERDLKQISGIWGLGWSSCLGSVEEVEEIASTIDQLIFGALMEEILEDFSDEIS